jgi:hypothetical protein
MTDLTPIQPPKLSIAYSATAELTVELAKVLALVAPISMTTEQQELWLARCRRRAGRDSRQRGPRNLCRASAIGHSSAPLSREWEINREAALRRAKARGREELNTIWEWERQARIDAGLHVDPRPEPLTRDELDHLRPDIRKLGLNSGFLEYRGGRLCEVQ